MGPPDNAEAGPGLDPAHISAFTTDTASVQEPSGPWPLSVCIAECARMLADLEAQRRAEQEAERRGRAGALSELRDFGAVMYRRGYEARDRQILNNHRRLAAEALGPRYRTAREAEERMWDGPRADFGRPRPGDFPGIKQRGTEVA